MTNTEMLERLRRARIELEPISKDHAWANSILNVLTKKHAELSFETRSQEVAAQEVAARRSGRAALQAIVTNNKKKRTNE